MYNSQIYYNFRVAAVIRSDGRYLLLVVELRTVLVTRGLHWSVAQYILHCKNLLFANEMMSESPDALEKNICFTNLSTSLG